MELFCFLHLSSHALFILPRSILYEFILIAFK